MLIISFFQKSDLGFRSNIFWLIDILPLGSGSVDPHIFADPDPDPESQNLLDPTDLDLGPKHCVQETLSDKFISWDCFSKFNKIVKNKK